MSCELSRYFKQMLSIGNNSASTALEINALWLEINEENTEVSVWWDGKIIMNNLELEGGSLVI
jgi:hypothetical protein